MPFPVLFEVAQALVGATISFIVLWLLYMLVSGLRHLLVWNSKNAAWGAAFLTVWALWFVAIHLGWA